MGQQRNDTGKAKTAPKHSPTKSERARIDNFLSEQNAKPPAPAVKIKRDKDGVYGVSFDHADPRLGGLLLMDGMGTKNPAFFDALLGQVMNAASSGSEPTERDVNFMLSVITGIEPRDELEAMLAAQMAAVHSATMTFARRLNYVENLPQQDSAERAFNKLARTFAAQMDALKRYRSKGEQKMTVEHVTVNEGGQAIVGNVESGGGGASKKQGTTP